MNDEYTRCCELLGVGPGAGGPELKAAYRDMAKVWHPDRFAHDPRLQQKAQEKLKEINEAYELLSSGRASRRAATRWDEDEQRAAPVRATRRGPSLWQSLLISVLIFGGVFLAARRVLIPMWKGEARAAAQPAAETQQPYTNDEGAEQQGAGASAAGNSRKRTMDQAAREMKATPTTAAPEVEAQVVRPLPTVTVTIDPTTGMLASASCPTRTRMTYPAGKEPGQYCNAPHQQDAPAEDAGAARPKQSRLKSLAKRIGLAH